MSSTKTLLILLIISTIGCQASKKQITPTKTSYYNLAEGLAERDCPDIIKLFSKQQSQFRADPQAYFENGDFRSYKHTDPDFEWYLLLDILIDQDILWELDHKTEPGDEDVNYAIKTLVNKKGYQMPDLSKIDVSDMEDLEQYSEAINKAWKTKNLVVIDIYLDGDSYIMGILKRTNLKSVCNLAKKCNQQMTSY